MRSPPPPATSVSGRSPAPITSTPRHPTVRPGRQEIARAAAQAGLRFVIFTDHGDGTRPPNPPEYIDNVLCLDGVEISTNGGHYVALDMRTSPFPLGGEASAVVEDVRRLGGFGIAAHPASLKDGLTWTDWSLTFDGLEWLNADSEWRDEARRQLAGAAIYYPFRPAGVLASLLDRPAALLARWDSLASVRPVVGLAAHDAHGGSHVPRRRIAASMGRQHSILSSEFPDVRGSRRSRLSSHRSCGRRRPGRARCDSTRPGLHID